MKNGAPPRSLHIEPTAMCNLRCAHCRGVAFPRTMLSFDLFRRILDSFLDVAVPEQVHFCGTGEPLLNPQTPAMWDYARGCCPESSLKVTTNLSMSIEKVIDPLLELLDVISVSVDGATADTYQAVRKNGNFARVSSNLTLLAKGRRERGLPLALNVNFTPSALNLQDIAKMPAFCRSVGADALLIWRISDTRDPVYDHLAQWRTGVQEALTKAKSMGIKVRVAPIVERDARLSAGQPSFCRAPLEWLNVTASGRLAPCCEIWEQADLKALSFPIVPDSEVAEAWRSRPLVELRGALSRGENRGACHDCHWFHHPFLAVGEPLLSASHPKPRHTTSQ